MNCIYMSPHISMDGLERRACGNVGLQSSNVVAAITEEAEIRKHWHSRHALKRILPADALIIFCSV